MSVSEFAVLGAIGVFPATSVAASAKKAAHTGSVHMIAPKRWKSGGHRWRASVPPAKHHRKHHPSPCPVRPVPEFGAATGVVAFLVGGGAFLAIRRRRLALC